MFANLLFGSVIFPRLQLVGKYLHLKQTKTMRFVKCELMIPVCSGKDYKTKNLRLYLLYLKCSHFSLTVLGTVFLRNKDSRKLFPFWSSEYCVKMEDNSRMLGEGKGQAESVHVFFKSVY